ncbi:HhH-GPD family protein [Methanohalophilus portucalensis]|nr:hypothetical protein [Methanohalophilus portucalensis]
MYMYSLAKRITKNHPFYHRDFPWRHTIDPYEVMIAEFMLRRTKAEQVVPVYCEFLSNFPTLKSLCNADISDIAHVTSHLGLHWRSADFKNASTFIEQEYNGQFPEERKKLLRIPGVGDYVAGVILTVCFKKKEYVVDCNIARFINRYYGLNLKGEIRRKKAIIEKAVDLFNYEYPGELLFSILDFTATTCKPRHPNCSRCFLNSLCVTGKMMV